MSNAFLVVGKLNEEDIKLVCEMCEPGNAGGCECVTGKLIDVSVCERCSGKENISSAGCTLRFCQGIFSALGS